MGFLRSERLFHSLMVGHGYFSVWAPEAELPNWQKPNPQTKIPRRKRDWKSGGLFWEVFEIPCGCWLTVWALVHLSHNGDAVGYNGLGGSFWTQCSQFLWLCKAVAGHSIQPLETPGCHYLELKRDLHGAKRTREGWCHSGREKTPGLTLSDGLKIMTWLPVIYCVWRAVGEGTFQLEILRGRPLWL